MSVFTDIASTPTLIAVGAPISQFLMTALANNDDYLLSAISNGASASQAISGSSLTLSGNLSAASVTISTASISTPGGTLTWSGITSFTGGATFSGNLTFAAVDLGLLQVINLSQGF